MKQKKAATFSSEDNKVTLVCDADTSLGAIHDFLLHVKGDIVNRILEAQKQQESEVEQIKTPKEEAAAEIEKEKETK